MRLSPTQGEREEKVKAFDREQLALFLATAHDRERRCYPLFFTMARMGLRIGEATALQWDDVNLDRREVYIVKGVSQGSVGTTKGGRARTCDMSLALRDVLQRHDAASKAGALKKGTERSGDSLVFPSLAGTHIDRNKAEKIFKRICRAATLPLHHTPHSLRHSYASLLLQDGVSRRVRVRAVGTREHQTDLRHLWQMAAEALSGCGGSARRRGSGGKR